MDVWCGLEPKKSPKVAPEEVTVRTVSGPISEEAECSDVAEGTEHSDTSERPYWRKVANTSGFLLIVITVMCHIFYY